VPAGKAEAVVIESAGGLIVSANDFVVVRDALSATSTEKFEVPAVAGVPLITPEEESVSPLASDPDVTDQRYGGVPPLAASVWE
jgi:hypothetical protein